MKVSIITPTKNCEISENTLESVLNQTSSNFEWIIAYDGVEKPNKHFFNTDKKIKEIFLGNNYGPSVARNVGFQISDGDIITYLDDGDELFLYRIEHILKLAVVESPFIFFSSYTIVQETGEFIYSPFMINPPDFKDVLGRRNVSIPLGVAHSRDLLVKIGGFQPGIVCGEDGIAWRRMLDFDPNIVLSNTIAGKYYVNNFGQSRTQKRFEMGGFAFDADRPDGSHGQYLDKDWYKKFHSRDLLEGQ